MSVIRKKLVLLTYDDDSFLGINNEGELVYKAGLEYTDHLEGGANIWNGQDSVLYVNERLAFDEERAAAYRSVRQTGAWSSPKIIKLFEDHQAKWPERVLNEDGRYKYEVPYLEGGNGAYLQDLLGPKKHQRKKLIFENIWYFDSKWLAGDALQSVFTIRAYAKANATLTPYQDLYVTAKYGSYTVQQRTKRGISKTLICPVDALNDTEVYFYCAERLSSVGDLSGFKPGLVDASAAVKLRSLKVGDESTSYENPNLKTLTLGNNTLLQSIDARGSIALGTGNQKSVDLTGCENLEEAYFERTAVTGVSFPVGGIARIIHLPGTITNLTLRNQKKITDLTVASYDYIRALRLENNSAAVDTLAILNRIPAGANIRLVGFYWEADNAAEIEDILDTLDTMQGIDIDGQGRDISVNSCKNTISGTIHTESLTGEQVASYNSRYPHITIAADMTTSFRYYHDEDGTLVKTVECHDGIPQEGQPTGMAKANSADGHYSYTFAGWSLTQGSTTVDPDALDNVIADRHLYAVYEAHVRTYPVYWNNSNGNRLETDENIEWGTTPTYDGTTPQNPTSGGGPFTAWVPTPAPITGPTTYTASYTPVHTVRFYNGSSLYVAEGFTNPQQVLEGGSAVLPSTDPTDPEGGDRIFTGWSPSPTNVRADLAVYAQYKANVEAPTATTADGAYGVEWDYSQSSPALTRKGLAASFSDPTPATSVSGSGSSPFDNIAPWKDMEIYVDVNGTPTKYTSALNLADNDVLVYIPEFYYTAYKDAANSKWLWAISPTAKEGYCKHPGSGRYVGRYHTGGSSSGVYSKSGIVPLVNTSQTDFRTYSAAKGTGWGMMDLATWSAIQMLYLVEFANFDSQTMLGEGYTGFSAVGAGGGTDGAAYHTIKLTGNHNQYRNIEDPFSNCRDWIDGFLGSTSSVYAGVGNSYTGSTSGLENTGLKLPSSGYIKGFGYSEYCAWAFIPDASGGSESTYVPDYANSNSSQRPASVGGNYSSNRNSGLFFFYAYNNASYTPANLGSRLQKT